MGEPYQLQGSRKDIETSLEILAKQRLNDVEDEAKALLAQARSEALTILGKARTQSQEKLEQTQSQVDTIRDNAYEEGFKAGFAEGYSDANAQVEQETLETLKSVQVLVDGAYEAERLILKNFEKQAVKIIAHITEKILCRELADQPDILLNMVEHAIDSLYLSGKIQVVVSSQVIQNLRQHSAATLEGMDSLRRFEWIADPALATTEIYIIGQEGCFNLSPSSQMDKILEPVEQMLKLPREHAKVNDSENDLELANNALSDETETLLEPAAEEAPIHSAQDAALPLSNPISSLNDLAPHDESDEPALVKPTPNALAAQASAYEFPSFDALLPEESQSEEAREELS